MMQRAQAHWLPDRQRLHLHHGPIDMIVGIEGGGRKDGFERAVARFDTLLEELVADLPRLRSRSGDLPPGDVPRAMVLATDLFAPDYITPMAAVAGAGADAVLAVITTGPGIDKAYVNNGGDVAFHITDGRTMRATVATVPPSQVTIRATDKSRGIATSGRGGRSHTMGIADSVTVLARQAAVADAAATMIANAVDLPRHPAIRRHPASDLNPDSDLGSRLVTTRVGHLSASDIDAALSAGRSYAALLRQRGVIDAAFLTLRGQSCVVGSPDLIETKEVHYA